jgi:Ser/Thr protein kinase RdoA (MazF antagonist)
VRRCDVVPAHSRIAARDYAPVQGASICRGRVKRLATRLFRPAAAAPMGAPSREPSRPLIGYHRAMVETHNQPSHPYQRLTPDVILSAVETLDLACDGRMLALNSYENRVYQIGIEDAAPIVAKFYRPDRWTRAAILEEHDFAAELAQHEIPVVAPLPDAQGATLHSYADFLFAVYPRCGGRWLELDDRQRRRRMGVLLGRIHAVGAARRFDHRATLSIETLGEAARRFILEQPLLPAYLRDAYATLTADLLVKIRALFDAAGPLRSIRLHGDCHAGNILWTDAGPHFVDLDDSCMGPAIQDLWMLLSGERDEARAQLVDILEGYQTFFDFDPASAVLSEALRTLRLMHYSAWIAARWSDPAFPRAFPWFASPRYWEEHVLTLREQAAAMDDPLVL